MGDPQLPDLVPDPPVQLRTFAEPGEPSKLLFTSTLANVGDGDFLLQGEKVFDEWQVSQQILYSESGSEVVPVPGEMVWGGDGHEHWHVARVAVYWLEALDEAGEPVDDFDRLYDSKVGFCFFDSHHELPYGPPELVYESSGCAEQGSRTFEMGLSRGWSDVYEFYLPGQEIDITDLPDGLYRLWGEADPEGWFREKTRRNNRTWADIELKTRAEDGARLAFVVGQGPGPSDY